MTLSIRNYNTGEWASTIHNFVASDTWSLKRSWRLDYGRSEESPWHTFSDFVLSSVLLFRSGEPEM